MLDRLGVHSDRIAGDLTIGVTLTAIGFGDLPIPHVTIGTGTKIMVIMFFIG